VRAEKLRVGFAYTAEEKDPPSIAGPVFSILYRLTSVALYMVILLCIVRVMQVRRAQAHTTPHHTTPLPLRRRRKQQL
jgi:hypothetical protein